MKDGYVKCAAAGIRVSLGNPSQNAERIVEKILEQDKAGVKVLVFPELTLSGYTCGDLFFQQSLLVGCKEALAAILKETKKTEVLACVGLPLFHDNQMYNTVAFIQKGRLLGLVAKTYIPNYNDINETRYFTGAPKNNIHVDFYGEDVLLGSKLLFKGPNGLIVGCEVCEDMWAPLNPATFHVLAGANLIVNPSASWEEGNKAELRKMVVTAASKRMCCGYIFACAGPGESTTNMVFAGHHLIAENGVLLKEAVKYRSDVIVSEIDVATINTERRKNSSFPPVDCEDYQVIPVDFAKQETTLTRKYKKLPFMNMKNGSYHDCLQEMFETQVQGLVRRMAHIHCKTIVVGLSGGLDSTLAILVAAKAMDAMGLKRDGILAVTMPCFGTTNRTYENACSLARELGATLREIPIKKAIIQHFEDISQDINNHDVTYENAQARERTQIIMDLANQCNGLVIGTGDLSELALGWATYNGDHMSMYAVNASVPKTVIRYMVEDLAVNWKNAALREVLQDILDTPVSPELLPPVDGDIAQKTEDLVGPYELHDFFLYHMFLFGSSPKKIYRIAVYTFQNDYDKETILKWLKIFYRRFFTQQFKRSCMPDGPKVTDISFSPRGSLCMPSDAVYALWTGELENM